MPIKVDGSELFEVAQVVHASAEAIRAAIPDALNSGGENLREDLIEEIYEGENGEIHAGLIRDAIRTDYATMYNPQYSLRSDNSSFRYVRWKTRLDERVCPICGPMHDEIMTEAEAHSRHPIHDNCRCYFEYIDLGGLMTDAGPDLIPPALDEIMDNIMDQFEESFN